MPRLSQELVSTAQRIASALAPPPVARVVLPSPREDRHGGFCAVQLADGSTGIAYLVLGHLRAPVGARPVPAAGDDVSAVAECLTDDDPVQRALALASINALTRHLLDRAGFQPALTAHSLGSLAVGPRDRLGMVGYFPPLVRRAREEGIPLTVVELRPELVEEAPGLAVTLDPARLADCTHIVCTSTTLLNETLEGLLAHARHCREFVLLGPSAGCVPDPLFARGVTGTGGAWVVEPAALLERAARGEPWGDATRKFSLRRDGSWPGVEEIIRRALRASPR